MAETTVHHATIIGAGLLGGSIGLAIRSRWPDAHVAGVGRRESSLAAAVRRGCIHSGHLDAAECVGDSDLVILATPVRAFDAHLRAIRDRLAASCLVTDVGSTKAEVVATGEEILGLGGPFVGSHPMAGNEKKGPSHATESLLRGALCVVTPTERTPAPLLERTEAFWSEIGMRTVRLSPGDHDRAVARVSHLPHLLAAALMRTPQPEDLPVAATGFADMTRLSGGDPEMWRDIVASNRDAIRRAVDRYEAQLTELRRLIDQDDIAAIERYLADAQHRYHRHQADR